MKEIRALSGVTRQGHQVASLVEGIVGTMNAEIILKAYPNEAGDKIRIMLPELKSFKQVRIDIDGHYLEFERKHA